MITIQAHHGPLALMRPPHRRAAAGTHVHHRPYVGLREREERGEPREDFNVPKVEAEKPETAERRRADDGRIREQRERERIACGITAPQDEPEEEVDEDEEEVPDVPVTALVRWRRAHTIDLRRVPLKERVRLRAQAPKTTRYWKPKARGDCDGIARPCPYVSCHHHLLLDPDGASLKVNFPEVMDDLIYIGPEMEDGRFFTIGGGRVVEGPHLWMMSATCAIDVAEEYGGTTHEEVGAAMNLTRERIRQIEAEIFAELRDRKDVQALAMFEAMAKGAEENVVLIPPPPPSIIPPASHAATVEVDAAPLASMLSIVGHRVRRAVRLRLPVGPAFALYIACPLAEVDTARALAREAKALGLRVVSGWHDRVATEEQTADPFVLRARLRQNFRDVLSADAMLVWAVAGQPRATFVEAGWAQVLGLPLFWVPALDGHNLAERGPGVQLVAADSPPMVMREVLRRIADLRGGGGDREIR